MTDSNTPSGVGNDPEQYFDLIELLLQLWRGED